MATLKYKNGDVWEELSLGGNSPNLDFYPINSVYIGYGIYGKGGMSAPGYVINAGLNTSTDDIAQISPATFLGGTWSIFGTTSSILIAPTLAQSVSDKMSNCYAQTTIRLNNNTQAAETSTLTGGGYPAKEPTINNKQATFFCLICWVRVA